MTTELDDFDAYFTCHNLKAGDILSQHQVASIHKVLQDLDDEMEASVAIHSHAREQVLRELGGDELVQLMEERSYDRVTNIIDRVTRKFKEDKELEPTNDLPTQAKILLETFNADLREAAKHGIDKESIIGLAGAVAEDLLLALPVQFRKIGVDCVIDGLRTRVCPPNDEQGIV